MLNIEIFLLLGLAAYATCASGNKPNKKGTMRRLICFCCDNSEVNNSKGKCKYTGGGDTTLGVNMDSIDGSDSPDSEPRPIEYYKCIAYKGLSNMDNKGYADGRLSALDLFGSLTVLFWSMTMLSRTLLP
ncbi:uncharacterized protein LOC126833011 isoform X3 [Adelges cooleyi]|uniref:uncharacterized protein LOC126833011 isoform X3 n=1 Tax=Adelges cooleyi TaxID=133065 RepID=UPI00217F82AD|nr:uncharacterized protein LOC126833011 isoform X3 [Adelges cooleyi]